jgi:hypothetical protein
MIRTPALPLVLLAGLAGCAGYQIGSRTLYSPEIATVHVPVFDSASFRPHLGEQLTEAVVKEIELKTPYKVVDRDRADSLLTGRIVSETKRVLVEDAFDQFREIEVNFAVQVQWLRRNGTVVRAPTTIPLAAPLVRFGQTSSLVAEAGQSIASANQKAISRLAEQIVATMEAPW